MMLETGLTIVLRFVVIVGAVQLLLNIVGTNIYDVRAINWRRYYARHPHARRFRVRPLVSVVVVTRNDERVITSYLDTLLKSFYRNVEIIIVDDASQDSTTRLIGEFIAQHPTSNVRLLAKRLVVKPLAAASAGYRKYGTGELVLVLDTKHTLDKRALTRAVRHCNADATIAVLKPKLTVMSDYSALGVLQKYQTLLSHRSQKPSSVLGSGIFNDGPGLYRREFFLTVTRGPARSLTRRNKLQTGRSYYADDCIVYVTAPKSLEHLLARSYQTVIERLEMFLVQCRLCTTATTGQNSLINWFRLLLTTCTGVAALFVPLLLSYFLYMSVILQEPIFLLVSGALLSLLLLFAIWDDTQLRVPQKLAYTFGIPLTYGLYFLISTVQATAIIAIALTPRKLLAK